MAILKKNRKKNIFFDEVIADNLDLNSAYREKPLDKKIFFIAAGIFFIIGAVAILRVFYLGGIRGDFYSARADANINAITVISAERGFILDRYGKKIVDNIPSFSLRFRSSKFIKYGEKEEIKGVLQKIGLTKDEFNKILSENNLENNDEIILKREISPEEVIFIEAADLKSVYVSKDVRRAFSEEFAHIVGHIGFPTRREIRERNLTSVDTVGRTNIEAVFDDILRGVNGRIIKYRDAGGKLLGTYTFNKATPGKNLKTTIDADLQKIFYARMNQALKNAGPGGAGIIINPLNGEILSLISLPSFSSENIVQSLNDKRRPMFNRAVSGLYSPASTIKPIVAVAALKENIIGTREMVFSAGYLSLPNRYDPDNPARFGDWRAHGWVDFFTAIAKSSNIFFYAVGGGLPHNRHLFMGQSDMSQGLGANRLIKYYSLFGLNRKTGISLSAEAEGRIPSPENKRERAGRPWSIGDTYNISIGQGEMLVTPIALINAISSIVNGGFIYRPNLILNNSPEKIYDISHMSEELKKAKEGMKDTVRESYGTASMLNRLPFETLGKTGSAQVTNNQTNAFFAGCGPLPVKSDNHAPICVLILIENAQGGGLNAVPVAYDIFKWYYENRVNVL